MSQRTRQVGRQIKMLFSRNSSEYSLSHTHSRKEKNLNEMQSDRGGEGNIQSVNTVNDINKIDVTWMRAKCEDMSNRHIFFRFFKSKNVRQQICIHYIQTHDTRGIHTQCSLCRSTSIRTTYNFKIQIKGTCQVAIYLFTGYVFHLLFHPLPLPSPLLRLQKNKKW